MVADTFSTDGVGVLLMGTGNDNNTWGANANNFDFQVLADAIANALVSTVTGGTLDLSGSPPPATTSQVRFAALIFNGTLGSNQVVQVPNLRKWWYVCNLTAGAFTLKMKTPTGSASSSIPQNSGWQIIYCDGSNGIVVWPFNTNQIQMPDGSLAAPAYSNVNEPNSGIRRAGTQDWRFVINGLDVLQITGPAGSPASVINILAPNVLQQAGIGIIPVGMEAPFAGPPGATGAPPAGWLRSNGVPASRVTDVALFNALSVQTTCTTAAANTTISALPADFRNQGLEGGSIEGGSIPLGTTIVSITATTMVLSAAPGANAAGVPIRLMPWGQGDGATTFGIPDRRGRSIFGLDTDPSVGAAGRITAGASGIAGDHLNGSGGLQTVSLVVGQLPVITPAGSISLATGTVPVSGAIGFSGSNITVGVSDPTHAHAVSDPTHAHSIQFTISSLGGQGVGGAQNAVTNVGSGGSVGATNVAATGIAIVGAATGITAAVSSSGIAVNLNWSGSASFNGNAQSFTGTAFGGNQAHQNMPPAGMGFWIIKR